ncbi:Threonylcarbamoyladenosine tRNA methylthiotransferase MtaB [compost metagenome]
MYREGYEAIKRIGFSEMHVFPYSKRTGTPAARMEDQVDEEIKHARVQELIDLSEQMQLAYAEKFVGQVLDVIPERDEKGVWGEGFVTGFSDNYLQIRFDGTPDLTGKMCRVKLTKADANTSEGQLVRVLDGAASAQALA